MSTLFTLAWLHLSDIHFLPDSEWQNSAARAALLTFLTRQLAERHIQVDLIFCTGDIAFGELKTQPLRAQYAMAREFFDQVLAICKCDKSRLFVVPGNHDIDRSCITRATQQSWTLWGTDKAHEMADIIPAGFAGLDADTRDAMRRLGVWGEFVADYLPHQRPAGTGHHHYAHTLEIKGRRIGIAGFNSAWTCGGEKDDRALWLAAGPQFDHMRKTLKDADVRIGLIHHPWDWFNVAERNTIKQRIGDEAHFWLHGHAHEEWVEAQAGHVTLGAGAVTAETEAECGCNLVELDFDGGQGRAYPFRYQKRRARWLNAIDVTPHGDGVWCFALPAALCAAVVGQAVPVLASSASRAAGEGGAGRTVQAAPAAPAQANDGQDELAKIPDGGFFNMLDQEQRDQAVWRALYTWALDWKRDVQGPYALAPNPWGAPLRVRPPTQGRPGGSAAASQALLHLARPAGKGVGALELTLDLDGIGLIAGLRLNGLHGQGFRYIEAGEFWMGSPATEADREEDEGPQHRVVIGAGFWLADTACTQGLWQAVMGSNPSHFQGGNGGGPEHPVEMVSWNMIQVFLQRLQGMLPACRVTLPTEAEWEYACRAGGATPFCFGETITTGQVNYDGNHPYGNGEEGEYRKTTVAVKALAANAWGLYQMHGNVWEWCADRLRAYGVEAVRDPGLAEVLDPPLDDKVAARVLRGGGWFRHARFARSAYRDQYEPDWLFLRTGLRLALRSEPGQ